MRKKTQTHTLVKKMHYNKEENMQFFEYMRFYTSVTIHKGRHAHDEQKKNHCLE